MQTLSDGHVMDYTKNVEPYVDPRFNATAAPVEPPVQSALPVTFEEEAIKVGTRLATPEETAQVNEIVQSAKASGRGIQSISKVEPEIQAVSQWNNVPPYNPLIVPGQVNELNNIPSFPSVYPWSQPFMPQLPNDMVALRAKVQGRIDALTSLETQSDEIKATIKTLTWVVEEIARHTVHFTNGSAP